MRKQTKEKQETPAEEKEWQTPPELAREIRINPDRIIGFILAGELEAVDVSERTSSRPRYRIHRTAVQDFLRRRAAVAVAPATPRRRQAASKREFY